MRVKYIFAASLALTLIACGSDTSVQSTQAQAEAQVDDTSQNKSSEPSATSEAPKRDIGREDMGNGFHLLTGPGGNILASTGKDGVFVVDDKFDRFGQQIIDTIGEISDSPIRFVINTHFHGDHTGANAEMKQVGATVVAHDNVRARMGTTFYNELWGEDVKATDPDRWPNLTFSENSTFYFNDQTIQIIHVPAAHTDGDSIVYFKEANILHMGDNYFNGMFPFVDVDGGGTVVGMISAQTTALDMIDADTQIVPGHGPLANKADLTATRDMIADIRNRVKTRIDAGDSMDKIIEDKILTDLSEYASFINEDAMITIAYRSLSGK